MEVEEKDAQVEERAVKGPPERIFGLSFLCLETLHCFCL